MIPLKSLSKAALVRAHEKAVRYRLLNEPAEAESICLDILSADPRNQEAIATLILAVTDRLGHDFRPAPGRLEELIGQLAGEYERHYYRGVVAERQAKAQLRAGVPGFLVRPSLQEALEHFEQAERLRPSDNEDALLRYNTCARLLNEDPALSERDEEHVEQPLD